MNQVKYCEVCGVECNTYKVKAGVINFLGKRRTLWRKVCSKCAMKVYKKKPMTKLSRVRKEKENR